MVVFTLPSARVLGSRGVSQGCLHTEAGGAAQAELGHREDKEGQCLEPLLEGAGPPQAPG